MRTANPPDYPGKPVRQERFRPGMVPLFAFRLIIVLSGLDELCVAHLPLVPLAADRTTHAHAIHTDAQQGIELALDADIDPFAGRRTGKVQTFHVRSPSRAPARALVDNNSASHCRMRHSSA
jgi:hypothetical protein